MLSHCLFDPPPLLSQIQAGLRLFLVLLFAVLVSSWWSSSTTLRATNEQLKKERKKTSEKIFISQIIFPLWKQAFDSRIGGRKWPCSIITMLNRHFSHCFSSLVNDLIGGNLDSLTVVILAGFLKWQAENIIYRYYIYRESFIELHRVLSAPVDIKYALPMHNMHMHY